VCSMSYCAAADSTATRAIVTHSSTGTRSMFDFRARQLARRPT
jgi:hypothetical protein